MRLRSAILAAAACGGALWGQTSAYQSSDGNTSIFLNNAKASLIFNVSDAKFDLGYLHEGAGKSWLYGLEATGKPSSDFSTIFQKGKTPPAVGGSASFGRHQPFSKDLTQQTAKDRLRDDWALLQLTYTRSTFDTATTSTSPVQPRRFDGYRALAVYNALVNAPGASMLLGAAAGIQRMNNTDQLTSATILTPLVQSAPGVPAFEAVRETDGYVGIYQKYLAAPVYSDVVWIPKSLPWLDFDAFTRSNTAHFSRYIEGGLGIFLAKPDNPTQVLGGLSLAWKNGTPAIGFVAGWAF
jgi:hypothetical protein